MPFEELWNSWKVTDRPTLTWKSLHFSYLQSLMPKSSSFLFSFSRPLPNTGAEFKLSIYPMYFYCRWRYMAQTQRVRRLTHTRHTSVWSQRVLPTPGQWVAESPPYSRSVSPSYSKSESAPIPRQRAQGTPSQRVHPILQVRDIPYTAIQKVHTAPYRRTHPAPGQRVYSSWSKSVISEGQKVHLTRP